MNPQFKKGILELFTLKIIQNEQPIYGYDIMRIISTILDGVDKATVYAILRRLHQGGMLDVEFMKSSSEGPKRKYYKLTSEGIHNLEEHISDLNKITEIAKKLGI